MVHVFCSPGMHMRRRMLLGLVLLAAFSLPAAARVELSGGRSQTTQRQWTNVFFAEWIGAPRPVWKLRWAPDVGLGRFNARPDLPGIRLHHDVWVGAAGARLYLWRNAFFGFQGALTDGKTDALSTPYEFVSTLGWQGHHWQVMVRHISNDDFHKPNHGETMLLLGLAF